MSKSKQRIISSDNEDGTYNVLHIIAEKGRDHVFEVIGEDLAQDHANSLAKVEDAKLQKLKGEL